MVATKSSRLIECGLTAIAITASLVTLYSLQANQQGLAPAQPAIIMHRLAR